MFVGNKKPMKRGRLKKPTIVSIKNIKSTKNIKSSKNINDLVNTMYSRSRKLLRRQ